MKESDVPQDVRNFREGENLKKLMYATDKDGHYVGKVSAGWEPENTATRQAWDVVEEQMAETIAEVKAGTLSPLAYWMEKSLMNVSLLAQYVGKWKWQVKNHLKPSGFNKLSDTMLAKYAAAFNITVEQLKQPDIA